MNAVSLRLLERPNQDEDDEVLLAVPSLSPTERVVLWHGLPPLLAPDHPAIAPVVLDGELDGRRTYAEQVPRGIRLSEVALPVPLLHFVVSELLRGLGMLHEAHQVHGAVFAHHVFLGLEGEVVLVGRGRQGGVFGMDVLGALSLVMKDDEITVSPSTADRLAEDLAREAPSDARVQLAAFVAENTRPVAISEQVVLVSGAQRDAVDEVVPDLGPDSDNRGILDRWAVSTSGRISNEEITDEIFSTQQTLGLTLWRRLSSPPEHRPPADRFAAVGGLPSRGIRALLADEPPDVLPLPLMGSVGDFVLPEPTWDDQPTVSRPIGDLATDEVAIDRELENTLHEVTFPGTTVPSARPTVGVPTWVQWLVAMAIGGGLVWVAMRFF